MDKKVSIAEIIPRGRIEKSIYVLRGEKVMLDSDLASLYGVSTKRLNEQVTRNIDRFPSDFMFLLTTSEDDLISGYENNKKHGGRRKLPRAFTEQGVAMLSSVLRSERAVQVNIAIMRAFVQLRELLASHKDLAERLDELESKYDKQFKQVFDAIRAMMMKEVKPKRQIGFKVGA